MKFIYHYLQFSGKYRPRLYLSMLFSFIQGTLANVPLFLMAYVIASIPQQGLNEALLKKIWLWLPLAVIIRFIFAYLFHYFQSFAVYDICRDERIALGDHFKRLSLGFFSAGNLGRVSSILTQDLVMVEEYSMNSVAVLINALAMIISGTIFLFYFSALCAISFIVITVLAIIAYFKMEKIGIREASTRQNQLEKLTATFLEYLMGISLIKVFRKNNLQQQKLYATIAETKTKAIQFEKTTTPPMTLNMCLFSLITAVLIALSFYEYSANHLSLLEAIIISLLGFILPLQIMVPQAMVLIIVETAMQRFKALKNLPVIDEDGQDLSLDDSEISFNSVNFSYDEKIDVLKDISFKINAQSLTAIVGPSGSGKTTLANLIMRFWDIDSGQITIGKRNISALSCDSLLANISAVFQRVYLFNDTIRNNILLGKPDATEDEIIRAAKAARCHDFIMALPQGYDTLVTSGGSSLSGGEKQRISIARAILKDAPIVIFDEATSAMDMDNEHHIQAALGTLIKGKTVVVIAHRLQTITAADQIIVLDCGRIVEKGRHEELLKAKGLYHRLWEKRQLAGNWKI